MCLNYKIHVFKNESSDTLVEKIENYKGPKILSKMVLHLKIRSRKAET